MYSEWLMDDAIYPVCHPHYQQEFGIEMLADLQQAALIEDIHTDMRWETWLNEHHQPVKPTILFVYRKRIYSDPKCVVLFSG